MSYERIILMLVFLSIMIVSAASIITSNSYEKSCRDMGGIVLYEYGLDNCYSNEKHEYIDIK